MAGTNFKLTHYQIVRAGSIDASAGITEGFKTSAFGSALKVVFSLVGAMLSSLFELKTSVIGNGIFGGPQAVGAINAGGRRSHDGGHDR